MTTFDDTLKQEKSADVEAFFTAIGEALKDAHPKVADIQELSGLLDGFHAVAEHFQNKAIAATTLTDGTKTVKPYDGGKPPA